MKRTLLKLTVAVWCITSAWSMGVPVRAQYSGFPVDNGQQYWQNYWRSQNQRPAAARPQTAPAGFQRYGGYYPTAPTPQKPFSNYQPAPNAYQQYWPLMVYPNSFGGYF
jgi:hypothetical protein